MKILAIDTSALVATAALCEDETPIAVSSQKSGLTHSATMLPIIKNIMDNTGTSIDDIDMFAVSEGPGSFTGIRIGISTVKGLAFGKNKICVGVSTLEAMARTVASFCTDALICPVMDARRNQLYNAIFEYRGGKLLRVTPDRTVMADDLARELESGDENDDYILVPTGMIDIDELIMTDVTLEVPFQLLCREDCKGLCPVCGSDLNEKTCNCNQKQIDPRLEKLKMLLDS